MTDRKKTAFTLAEMMTVLLVMSIIIAAFVPIVVSRLRLSPAPGGNSLWQYVSSGTGSGRDIYFGQGDSVSVLLNNTSHSGENTSKLLLNDKSGRAAAFLRVGNVTKGLLSMTGGSPSFGNTSFKSDKSVSIGYKASASCDSGVAIGYNANAAPDTSDYPACIGVVAIGNASSASGVDSVALGGSTAKGSSISGAVTDSPVSIGYLAYAKGSGVAIGHNSNLASKSDGVVAVGKNTLNVSGDSVNTVAVGANAFSAYSGKEAVAVGANALNQPSKNDPSYSVAVGYNALTYNNGIPLYTAPSVAVGSGAGTALMEGSVGVGYNAISGGDSIYDVVIGYQARSGLAGSAFSTGNSVAIGYQAMSNLLQGNNFNIAIGARALKNSSSSTSENIAIGTDALSNNAGGSSNVALGNAAAKSALNAIESVVIGSNALSSLTNGDSTYNTIIGANAALNEQSGSNNIAIGSGALKTNSSNPYIGGYNIAIGSGACSNLRSGAANKICIGAGSGPTQFTGNDNDQVENIFIGTSGKDLGGPAIMFGENAGNGTSTTRFTVYGNMHVLGAKSEGSDRRIKNIKGINNEGIEIIKKIKTYNYVLKKDKEQSPRVGVIAQEIKKILPHAVSTAPGGYLAVNKSEIFYRMMNAIKQLDRQLEEIKNKTEEILQSINKIESVLSKFSDKKKSVAEELIAQNKRLKFQNEKLSKRNELIEKRIAKIEKETR